MDHDAAAGAHRRYQLIANLLHAGIVDHADTDVFATRAEFGDARGDFGAAIAIRLQGLGAPCPKQQRITGLDHAPRHRPALAAEADEATLHHAQLLLRGAQPALMPLSMLTQAP
jgi:hypothetical protein